MKNIPRLTANRILSSPSHGYASFITDRRQLVKIHCHSYYELFIVAQGYGTHLINSTSEPLSPGALYFIRPDDVHCYMDVTSNFKIINMIVPEETFDRLTQYLGGTFRDDLLSPPCPLHVQVSMKEFKSILTELEQLVLTKKILKEKSDVFFRITVFGLLTKYFVLSPQKSSNRTPEWLRWLSLETVSYTHLPSPFIPSPPATAPPRADSVPGRHRQLQALPRSARKRLLLPKPHLHPGLAPQMVDNRQEIFSLQPVQAHHRSQRNPTALTLRHFHLLNDPITAQAHKAGQKIPGAVPFPASVQLKPVLMVIGGVGSNPNRPALSQKALRHGGLPVPVSYTHLDVYKRQSQCRGQLPLPF